MNQLDLIIVTLKGLVDHESSRLARLWEKARKTAAIPIIGFNIIPLIGVLLLGWSAGELLLVYWSESAAIGFYNILKFFILFLNEPIKSKGIIAGINERVSKFFAFAFIAGFFTVHFGGFMLGHLVFILLIISFGGGGLSPSGDPFDVDLIGMLANASIGILGFFISHGISFVKNFLIEKEYKRADQGMIMFAPYGRIVLMHIAIILGMFLLIITEPLGLPAIGPLLILIIGKTSFDITAHVAEHEKLRNI